VLNPQSATGNAQATFGHAVQLLNTQATGTSAGLGIISRWQLLQTQPLLYRTSYHYQFADAQSGQTAASSTSSCTFSAVQSGDQVLVPLQKSSAQETHINMRVAMAATLSTTLSYNVLGIVSLPFSTFSQENTRWRAMSVTSGTARVVVAALIPRKSST
jgi:hypothetical protein